MDKRIFSTYLKYNLYIEHASVEHHTFPSERKYTTIAYIAYGSGKAIIANHTFDVKTRDIFIINPSVNTEFIKTGDIFEIHYILFDKDFLRGEWDKWAEEFINHESFFKNDGQEFVKTSDSEANEIRNYIVKLITEYYENAKGRSSALLGYLYVIIPLIFRYGVTDEVRLFSKNMLVDQAIRQIHNTIYTNPKPSEIAAHRFVTREHLGRVFKKETGITITQYINKLRVDITKDILKNTDKPIEEIHLALNIDVKYLQKIFRQYVGMSMREYRSKNHYR